MPFLKVSSKKQALYELALRASQICQQTSQNIFHALIERERLGSTVITEGFAMPHTKLSGLDDYVAVFMRLQEPIMFDDYNNARVDLIFMLLAPDLGGAKHLKLLAHCHELFQNTDLCDQIRQARPQSKAILELLHTHIDEQQE